MELAGRMNASRWDSWACIRVLDEKGNWLRGGCGGNWGPQMPMKCPSCGGPLNKTERDSVRVIDLGGA